MEAAYHAVLGPSSAHRWRKCTASVYASRGFPNDGSDASRIGTACHEISARCLQQNLDPRDFIGRTFLFCKALDGKRYENLREDIATDWTGLVTEHELEITDEHAEWVGEYITFVRQQVELLGGVLHVETRVPIGHITGEEGGAGTSDVFIIVPQQKLIVVVDAKFGRNKVLAYEILKVALPDPITGEMQPPLYAPNDQLALYAGGALHEQELFYEFEQVKLIIVQPPLNSVSEFGMSVESLRAHLEQVKFDAEQTRVNRTYVAGDHCTYCPARISCTPRDEFVLKSSLEGFGDVSDAAQLAQSVPKQFAGNMIGVLLMLVPTIRSWCDDIEQRVYNTLVSGGEVIAPDGSAYKLVAGRKGRREWTNPALAEDVLKKMRLKKEEMYSFKLISPTTAEKLATAKKPKKGEEAVEALIGKNQWIKLQRLIAQADPKPVVAPGTDPRPVFAPALEGFTTTPVSQPSADADLF